MHIPDGMLQGAVCPVTAVASAAGIISCAIIAARSQDKPKAGRFAAITAFIFAAQMLNFPVAHGTSGHLLGGVLAASLLGIPFGVLAMALVVIVQAVFFADGGLSVLGANIFNMALVGSSFGGLMYHLLKSRIPKIGAHLNLSLAAWFSILAAAGMCSLQLLFSRVAEPGAVFASMLGVHALIGIGEALITVCAYAVFTRPIKLPALSTAVPLAVAAVCALALSPFASGFPDGLESVAEKYGFLGGEAVAHFAPWPDYSVTIINNPAFSTSLAGLIGVCLIFGLAFVLMRGRVST
jgi:cobalt/nickel transport system permease protein